MSIVITKALEQSFPGGTNLCFPDIQCQKDTPTAIMGASGAGKTTLLHLLAGLRKPSSGKVIIDHTTINQLSRREMTHFRGNHIGIVFQSAHFIAALNVLENLLLAPFFSRKKSSIAQAKSLLAAVGLLQHARKSPSQLSKGEQQRLSIVRALFHNPKLVLADEPTSSLDDHNCERIAQLLLSTTQQSGAILIVTTHDQRLASYFPQKITL